jgi:DNA modification methylase
MTYQLIQASAHDTGLPDKSVHCIVTSPPYMGLRSYAGEQMIEWPTVRYSPMPGLPEITIQGCEPGCVHEWASQIITPKHNDDGVKGSTLGGGKATQAQSQRTPIVQDVCIHCGGWRGGLGNEPTPEAFIGHLILVMREMHRILRDDGTCFVNLGDSFSGSGGAHAATHQNDGLSKSRDRDGVVLGGKKAGIPAKNLYMIPSRFALACQADGWIVRSRMPWIKRNGMPDSCEDRPSQVIEDIFMLAKSQDYFFDMHAIKQPFADERGGNPGAYKWSYANDAESGKGVRGKGGPSTKLQSEGWNANGEKSGRNFRSSDFFFKTWQGLATSEEGEPLAMVINTKAYSGAHFACFPPDLPLTLIKAGTSAHGVCPKCGAQWERMVEKGERVTIPRLAEGNEGLDSKMYGPAGWNTYNTVGWQPSCTCNAGEPIPAIVCDPFNGSGSTGKAALQLNRSYVGVDISKQYLEELAPERLSNIQIELALA